MVSPLRVLYRRNVLGIGYAEVGILVVLTGVAPLLVVSVAGLRTDRAGRRRMSRIVMTLDAASFLGLAYARRVHSRVFVLLFAGGGQVVGTIVGPALSASV